MDHGFKNLLKLYQKFKLLSQWTFSFIYSQSHSVQYLTSYNEYRRFLSDLFYTLFFHVRKGSIISLWKWKVTLLFLFEFCYFSFYYNFFIVRGQESRWLQWQSVLVELKSTFLLFMYLTNRVFHYNLLVPNRVFTDHLIVVIFE